MTAPDPHRCPHCGDTHSVATMVADHIKKHSGEEIAL
jgi:hypothetical protein